MARRTEIAYNDSSTSKESAQVIRVNKLIEAEAETEVEIEIETEIEQQCLQCIVTRLPLCSIRKSQIVTQMKLHFYKYHGTGNDFIVADNRHGGYSALTTKQIHRLCDRRFGIGADGLMLLENADGYDFRMLYYNADGREGSMCGNGGRCLVQFAYQLGIHKSKYRFIAVDGEHDAEKDTDGWVSLKMKDVHAVQFKDNHFVLNTGSPHYVKFVDDVLHYDVTGEGRRIRNSAAYAAEGINVNFVEQAHRRIIVRTFERGVEAETLSCGTGATAAALVSAHNERGFNSIDVQMPGGDLCVEFDKLGDHDFENIWLSGPAVMVFEGVVQIENAGD
jgi:diaminopimelate epimerase